MPRTAARPAETKPAAAKSSRAPAAPVGAATPAPARRSAAAVQVPPPAAAAPKTARPDRPARLAKMEKLEKLDRVDKVAKPARADKADKADKVEKPEKAEKAAKPRLRMVRDSFTMPEADFALIAQLKAGATAAGRPAKKSELLRAGLRLLAAQPAKALMGALDSLEPVKLGRPKQAG
jgi:hypothetical protein